MEGYIADWLNLLIRWLHFITGAAWIGTSFYFNWLNHNIREPEKKQDRIKGELFAVHGGHFYQVRKYDGAPEVLPKTLHWFKWEAYFTWISGFSLLSVVYYWNAKMNLVGMGEGSLEPWQGVALSVGGLVGGWIIYDLLCKSPLAKNPVAFAVLGFSLLTAAAFGYSQILTPRASYIQIGAMIGTMMAANVFFVIIPNQRVMVDTMIAGEEPDTSLGDAGALRSLHNNYFTLPVLFIMISNHFPMTFGHAFNWAVLAAIALIGAGIRHYFNLKSKGHLNVWILPVASVAILALAFVIRPAPTPQADVQASISYDQVQPIIKERCMACHAKSPTLVPSAPKGVMYDDPAVVQGIASKIKMQLSTNVMPPGNITKMTEEERALVISWVDAGASIPQ